MEKDIKAVNISPLMGTEHEYFESRKEDLRSGYEAGIQKMAEDWEVSSKAVEALSRKRFKKVHLCTFFGEITIRCHEGVDGNGLWKCPALTYFGIRPYQRFSPEMEKRFSVFAAEAGSYEKAAGISETTWFPVSDGAVRSTVQRLSAAGGPTGTCENAAGPQDTLIVMADGWLARHRGENWGLKKKNRKLPERIHWYEIRAAVIFKLSSLVAVSGKRNAIMQKHVMAVPAETSPYDFGVALEGEMERMGFLQAKSVFFVMDGGVWLWNIFKDRFESCSKAMLDFYHLSQHLHALGTVLHGGDAKKNEAWCGKILHSLKHKSPKRLFKTLDDLVKNPPSDSPEALEAIRAQNIYFRKHEEHMGYAENAKLGVPIGSGSMESLCSQFQNRLKRTGQFWEKDGFAALLKIIVRRWNGELDSLWMSCAI